MNNTIKTVAETYLREVLDYKKRFLLAEASTLSSLGATPNQVRKAHTDKDIQIVADAEYEVVKNKKFIMSVIKSVAGKDYISGESVIGFDKEKNMFVAGTSNNKWFISKINPEGEEIEGWFETSPAKMLTRFTGVTVYYVSRTGSRDTKLKVFDQSERVKALETVVRIELFPLAKKYLEQEFETIKVLIKSKITNALDKDDYDSVYGLLQKLSADQRKGFFSTGKGTTSVNDFIHGRDFINNEIERRLKDNMTILLRNKYGDDIYFKIEDEMFYPEMKKVGYEVVVDAIKELKSNMGIK